MTVRELIQQLERQDPNSVILVSVDISPVECDEESAQDRVFAAEFVDCFSDSGQTVLCFVGDTNLED